MFLYLSPKLCRLEEAVVLITEPRKVEILNDLKEFFNFNSFL